ncbi:MAG: hypothetical protein IKN38_01315 [Clostridia bacterium]|nr:hypothetical protein [Clostridia bacterium]
MKSYLEKRLEKYEKRRRIECDEELIAAVSEILEAEKKKPPLLRNNDLIAEAADALIDLCGAGDGIEDEIDRCREALSSSLSEEERPDRGRIAPALKWLIPAAIIISLFFALPSSAHEFRYLATRLTLEERRIVDNTEVGKTRTVGDNEYSSSKWIKYVDITSLRQLSELIDVRGVLFPLSLENKYEMTYNYEDFGTYKYGCISIDQEDVFASITIETCERYVDVKYERERIGDFDVFVSEYEDLMRPGEMRYQFEFNYNGSSYLIGSNKYEISLEILNSMEEIKE